MKKQNVNNKLAFQKTAVTELNDNHLANINGGSDPLFISGLALGVGFSIIMSVVILVN